jgi:transposase
VSERDAQIWVSRANGSTYREIAKHFGIHHSRAREICLSVQRKIERRWHFFQAARQTLTLKSWEGF